MRRNILILLFIIFALTTNNSLAQSWKTGKVIFESSDIVGNRLIESLYMANADGSDLEKLTECWIIDGNLGKEYWNFALSPDCKEIAFNIGNHDLIRNVGTSRDVAVLQIDTGDIENLTDSKNDVYCYSPHWSPDGRQIVFTRMSTPDYVNEVCIMNSDGSNVRKIGEGTALDWSPDGRTIIFMRSKWDIYTVYTMDTNGGNVKEIVGNMSFVTDLRYSPDGKWIAYNVQQIGGGDNRVYIMDSDGSNLKLLMTLDGRFYCWSPDSKKLAIGAEIAPDDRIRIWLVDPFKADGGVPERLTNSNREEQSFDWRDPALFHVGIGLQSSTAITTWGYIKNKR